MANAAGMACRVVCSGVFIRRFFLQGTPPPPSRGSIPAASPSAPASPDNNNDNAGQRREPNGRSRRNLWRQVVAGALPHPGVVAAMAASSAAAFAASPSSNSSSSASAADGGGGDVPWDAAGGAARHVAVGGVCFVATAAVFARCEAAFVGEVAALWAARRRPSGDGGGRGVVGGREKTD